MGEQDSVDLIVINSDNDVVSSHLSCSFSFFLFLDCSKQHVQLQPGTVVPCHNKAAASTKMTLLYPSMYLLHADIGERHFRITLLYPIIHHIRVSYTVDFR